MKTIFLQSHTITVPRRQESPPSGPRVSAALPGERRAIVGDFG